MYEAKKVLEIKVVVNTKLNVLPMQAYRAKSGLKILGHVKEVLRDFIVDLDLQDNKAGGA